MIINPNVDRSEVNDTAIDGAQSIIYINNESNQINERKDSKSMIPVQEYTNNAHNM